VQPDLRPSPTPAPPARDPYLDLLRAGSLLVVVLWHWVFTVLRWSADGPHASNPIATTPGLWLATWFLQVMPVFFFVGGYVHHRTWHANRSRGGTDRAFLRRRLSRLLVPTLALLGAVAAVRLATATLTPDEAWIDRGLFLLVSPLWFLAVYVLLVLVTPVAVRLDQRAGAWALLLFAGGVLLVDLARFHLGVPYLEWANFLFVYGFAHQLGFSWERLAAAGGRRAGHLALGGFAGLVALTTLGPYPRSMVGVPGESISNMAPPTACILALCCFQVGLVLLARPRLTSWLRAGGGARPVAWANRNAMTLFLWHFTGYAGFVGLLHLIGVGLADRPDALWWLQRPVWLIGPALCTVPLLRLFRRLEHR
jgi:hypothetical protein